MRVPYKKSGLFTDPRRPTPLRARECAYRAKKILASKDPPAELVPIQLVQDEVQQKKLRAL